MGHLLHVPQFKNLLQSRFVVLPICVWVSIESDCSMKTCKAALGEREMLGQSQACLAVKNERAIAALLLNSGYGWAGMSQGTDVKCYSILKLQEGFSSPLSCYLALPWNCTAQPVRLGTAGSELWDWQPLKVQSYHSPELCSFFSLNW